MKTSMEIHSREILIQIRNQRREFVDFIKKLAEIETPTSIPSSQSTLFELLTHELENIDYKVEHLPGEHSGGQIYAYPQNRRKGQSGQLLLGHCDTVWPIGTLKDMPIEENGSILKGPGVYDMKAGLTMIIFVLRTIHQLGLEPPLTPVVFINSDEEAGSEDSSNRIRTIARNVKRTFVMEPSLNASGKLKTARKGVGEFEIRVSGQASHAGLDPGKGASAVLELSHVIQQLFNLNDPEKGINVNVGTIDGGIRANVVAADSKATVDVRVPTHKDAERIEKAIRDIQPRTPGVSLRIKGGINRAPMQKTPRNDQLWQTAYSLGQEIGLDLEDGTSGGASDGNFTSLFTATLDGLGAVGDGAHSNNEHIDIDKTLDRCALLCLLLLAPDDA